MRWVLMAFAVVTAFGGAVRADTNRPWSENVSQAEQSLAQRMLEDGNRLFEESQHLKALERYREALTHWDHPLIRYNIAVCLLDLDHPLEAVEQFDRALKFGEAPLGASVYAHALRYHKRLQREIAEVEVSCVQTGVEVTLDGKPLFTAPNRALRRVTPGNHQLVATKAGFVTMTREIRVIGGERSAQEIELATVSASTKLERRWSQWKPWLVFGLGIAVGVAGVPVELAARSSMIAYDQEIKSTCPPATGCTMSPRAQTLYDRAQAEHVAAITMFSVGGAVAVTGAILLILNAPRAVVSERVTWAPTFGPDRAGFTVGGRF